MIIGDELIVISILILNAVIIVCWTVLAVVFNKWWIALFAILCFFTCRNENKHDQYYVICDVCGKHSPYAKDHNSSIEEAKKAGWIRRRSGDKFEDFCPDCQSKSTDTKQ